MSSALLKRERARERGREMEGKRERERTRERKRERESEKERENPAYTHTLHSHTLPFIMRMYPNPTRLNAAPCIPTPYAIRTAPDALQS